MIQKQKTPNSFSLFSVAVFIMSIVSCYTTALGVEPMLGNTFLSWIVAAALSIFLLAIALKFPEAYQAGRHHQMVWAYSSVAMFSVLLNFNAIYSTFTAHNVIFNELVDKRNQIGQLANSGIFLLKKGAGLDVAERELEAAKIAYENEVNNPNKPGHGKIAEELYQNRTNAEAKMSAAYNSIETEVIKINSLKESSIYLADSIKSALKIGNKNVRNITELKYSVEYVIDNYNEIINILNAKLGKNGPGFAKIRFENRDAGNLNHTLTVLSKIFTLRGEQATSVIVSMLLSILIDFIVLFVLLLTNVGGKKEIRNRKPYTAIPRSKKSIIMDRDIGE